MLKDKNGDSKTNPKQRTLLSKVVELVTSEIKPSIKEDFYDKNLQNNQEIEQNAASPSDRASAAEKPAGDESVIKRQFLDKTMSDFNSVLLSKHVVSEKTPESSDAEEGRTLAAVAAEAVEQKTDTGLPPETVKLLNALEISPEQYIAFVNDVIGHIDDMLKKSSVSEAIDKWHGLYENFRIGLQLGFRYFTDAIINSDEDIPDQEEVGSPWSWHTWETMVGNLLNNFDRYCAKEITDYLKAPGTLISEESVIELFQNLSNQNHGGDALLEQALNELDKNITEKVTGLLSKLEMSEKLESIIHTPSTVANDFETYLWANYITKRKIGSYGNSLRDRLLLNPRIAPKGQVTARLKFLKVAEADELDKIVGRASNDQLKRLHDWARENVCQFNIWEKICYDSTRFLPRSAQL